MIFFMLSAWSKVYFCRNSEEKLMQITAFNQIHKQLGAKMVEFAGFEMPIEYSGIKDEHMTVREAVGVFDVSHMGEFWVKGPNAF